MYNRTKHIIYSKDIMAYIKRITRNSMSIVEDVMEHGGHVGLRLKILIYF
jgi:hypothetical protein